MVKIPIFRDLHQNHLPCLAESSEILHLSLCYCQQFVDLKTAEILFYTLVVLFLALNVDSLYNDQQAPVPVGDIYRLPKYKVPLPPTPPRKSQNSVRKDSFERSSFGKENVDAEGMIFYIP